MYPDPRAVRPDNKIRSGPEKRPSPFRRDRGAPAFTVEMGKLPPGASKSMTTLLQQIGVSRPVQGGSDEVEDPLVDSAAVYACIAKLSEAARSVPLRVWESDAEEANEVPEAHPVRAMFESPNPYMGLPDLIEAGVVHYMTSGEDWWFLMDEDSRPITADSDPKSRIPLPRFIFPRPGDEVMDKRDTRTNRILSVNYATGMPDFAVGSTFHVAKYNRRDPQRGLAPIDVALRAISVGFQAERYQEGVMRSGGPGAYLNYEQEMAPDEERRVQEEVNESLRDGDLLGGLKVLTGKVAVLPNPATPKDMLPAETLDWARDTVCMVLGVPPPVIGVLDQSTYNNITEAYRQFWATVKGYLDALAAKLNSHLLGRLSDPRLARCRVSFDLSGIDALQKDQTAKYDLGIKLATSGVPMSFGAAMAMQGVDVEVPDAANEQVVMPFGMTLTNPDEADAPPPPEPPAAPPVTGILEVVQAVSDGLLTPDAAVAVLLAAFPSMDEGAARRIVAGAIVSEGEEDPDPEPDPETPPPADEEPEGEPPGDEGKSLEAPPRALPPLDSEDARAAYQARYVEKVLAKPERELKGDVLRYLNDYAEAQLKRLRQYAEDGPNVAGRAYLPVERDYGIDEEVRRFLLLIEQRWVDDLAELARAPLRSAFTGAIEDMADELSVIAIDATDPRIANALSTQQIKLAEGVTSRLADRVKATILEALANPGADAAAPLQLRIREVLPELTENLRQVFGTNEARAATIAQTETAKAVGTAREIQMVEAGVTEHQWVSNRDAAVRDSHRELDGEVRRIGEAFKPNLKRPNDPDGPASETINCRCVAKPIVP